MNFKLDQAVEILSRTPLALRALLDNLSGEWTTAAEDPEQWSPFDIVGHLIHGEETDWIPRAEIILARGENVAFEPFDRFAQLEKPRNRAISELLLDFERLREINLSKLRAFDLGPAELALKGVHPELGEVTLEQLLATWAVHDLTHIRQIVVFMARKYTGLVGPWKEYLSILQ